MPSSLFSSVSRSLNSYKLHRNRIYSSDSHQILCIYFPWAGTQAPLGLYGNFSRM